jgi:hypothetical protein
MQQVHKVVLFSRMGLRTVAEGSYIVQVYRPLPNLYVFTRH